MVVKLFVIQAVNVIECKIEVIFGLQQSFFLSFDNDSVSYYLNDEMASQISVKIGSDNGLLPDSTMSSAAGQIQTNTCLCLQEFPIFNGLMNVSSFTCSLYPPLQRSWRGYTGFTLSVCGQNRVRSVSSTILIGSISYLHILSSNFRRCATCNVCFEILTFEILVNSLNL